MARLPWSDFIRAYPRGHLVVGYLEAAPDKAGITQVQEARTALLRLLRKLKLEADYTLSIERTWHLPSLHVAFASEKDAAALARVVGARPMATADDPAWASKQTSQLDLEAVATMAGPPNKRRVSRAEEYREPG